MTCAGGGSPERLAILAREAARPRVGRAPTRPRLWGAVPEEKRRRKGPESTVKQDIFDAAKAEAWPCSFWNNPRGLANVGARGKLAFGVGPNGAADLIGLMHGSGLFLSLETKAAFGKVEEHQEAWAAWVRAHGGVAGRANSVDEARALVNSWRK